MCAHCSWNCSRYSCSLTRNNKIYIFSWRSSRRFEEKWVVWMHIGDAALNMHILKQTAMRCVPCVSKIFVTKLPSLRGEMGCMDAYWWRSAQHAHFETDDAAVCAVCFKSLRDEAPVASWRNGLYGCILRTQRSRGTIWNRRRGAVCRVFQKSSWRSSRRFVENLTIWMYIGDAALRWTFWIRWRRAACCVFQKSSWRSSRRFVEKWSLWVYIGDAALRCTFLNRRRDTSCCMFQNSSWRSYQLFVDEVPHISRSDGIIKVLKRLAIWWILSVAVCFKTVST